MDNPLNRPNKLTSPVPEPRGASEGIVQFDATARRREKMRQAAASASRESSQPPLAAPAADGRADAEKFLVNFVVEHTGYPAEIVDLDADLEADMGIDSIKKVQLFGELCESFAIEPAKDLRLDAFPTLRHVLEYLRANRAGGSAEAPPQGAAAAATQPAAEMEGYLVNFVVEQTGYPAEVVDLDADLEADLGIDSIKKVQLFGELCEHFALGPVKNLRLDAFPTLRHVLEFCRNAGTAGAYG